MKRLFGTLVDVALVSAVLASAYSAFDGRRDAAGRGVDAPPETVDPTMWSELQVSGISVGPADAKNIAVVFSDVQCPYCAQFHEVYRRVVDSSPPGTLRLQFVHYPLAYHRQARTAALAVQCAASSDMAGKALDILFAARDTLDLVDYAGLATMIELEDPTEFVNCMSHPATAEAVDSGLRLGDRVGVRGTPTVMLNGYRFIGSPDVVRFRQRLHP